MIMETIREPYLNRIRMKYTYYGEVLPTAEREQYNQTIAARIAKGSIAAI
jgi:hypothetical protein